MRKAAANAKSGCKGTNKIDNRQVIIEFFIKIGVFFV